MNEKLERKLEERKQKASDLARNLASAIRRAKSAYGDRKREISADYKDLYLSLGIDSGTQHFSSDYGGDMDYTKEDVKVRYCGELVLDVNFDWEIKVIRYLPKKKWLDIANDYISKGYLIEKNERIKRNKEKCPERKAARLRKKQAKEKKLKDYLKENFGLYSS